MAGKILPEIKVSGEEIFDGKVLRLEKDVVRLPEGQTAFREVIRHKGAVCVIPIDAEGNVIFVSQYRYAIQMETLEIPAGKLDYVGEEPASAALRELSEETGYTSSRLVDLGVYYGSPAILDEKIYMFAALDLRKGEAHPDADEYLSAKKMPIDEAVQLVLDGKVPDGKTQCAVLRLKMMLENGTLAPST